MKLARRAAAEVAVGARVGAWLLAVALLAAAWLRLGLPQPVCALKHWTGLPCLTCGSTRLSEALLRGELLEAASWNPLVFAALTLLGAWAAGSTVRAAFGWPSWRLVFAPEERKAVAIVAAAAVVAGWAYLVWRGV